MLPLLALFPLLDISFPSTGGAALAGAGFAILAGGLSPVLSG